MPQCLGSLLERSSFEEYLQLLNIPTRSSQQLAHLQSYHQCVKSMEPSSFCDVLVILWAWVNLCNSCGPSISKKYGFGKVLVRTFPLVLWCHHCHHYHLAPLVPLAPLPPLASLAPLSPRSLSPLAHFTAVTTTTLNTAHGHYFQFRHRCRRCHHCHHCQKCA